MSASKPVYIAYTERQVGDLVYVATRDRISVPEGWTDLTQNRATNSQVEAYRVIAVGDPDVAQAWNLDIDEPESFAVLVFRYAAPVTGGSARLDVPAIQSGDASDSFVTSIPLVGN